MGIAERWKVGISQIIAHLTEIFQLSFGEFESLLHSEFSLQAHYLYFPPSQRQTRLRRVVMMTIIHYIKIMYV